MLSTCDGMLRDCRVLFGVPYGAPFNRKKIEGEEDRGLFMTETACLRSVTSQTTTHSIVMLDVFDVF